jgi:hypothetical protein
MSWKVPKGKPPKVTVELSDEDWSILTFLIGIAMGKLSVDGGSSDAQKKAVDRYMLQRGGHPYHFTKEQLENEE